MQIINILLLNLSLELFESQIPVLFMNDDVTSYDNLYNVLIVNLSAVLSLLVSYFCSFIYAMYREYPLCAHCLRWTPYNGKTISSEKQGIQAISR